MPFFPVLLALFFLVPLVEIYILIEVGGLIGALPTVFLVVATAVIGAGLLRWQGLTTWLRVQQTLARGELPAVEMLEGAVLLVGGALLLTPGFVTDALGFLCLIPPARQAAIRAFLRRGRVTVHRASGSGRPGDRRGGPRGRVIEGEWRRDDKQQ